MSNELFRKMNIASGSRLPPGGRLGRRGNKNQVDSRLIEKIWRPDIYFDYEKRSTRKIGSANVSRKNKKKFEPKGHFRTFFRKNFLFAIISGQFHVDPENLSPWVEWGQILIPSGNNSTYDDS